MTTPVPIPPLIQAAPWPALGSANYNDEAYAAGATQPAAFARQAEIAQAGHYNAQISHDNAQVALTSATAAATAADAAAGAANFAGLWPSLTGELKKPATVKNGGRFWLLLQDLADVTAHEPAEGPYWTARDAGVITRRVTANEVATFGVVHALMTAGITLQIPDTPLDSDFVEIANASGSTCWLDWSGKWVNNQAPRSPMAFPPGARIRIYWYASQETWA